MKLNVPERSVLLELIPKKVGELTASAARRLQRKLELSDTDLAAIGVTERPPCPTCGFSGGSVWTKKRADEHIVNVPFSKWEVECLKVAIDELRKKSELPISFVDAVQKFEREANLASTAEEAEEEIVA